MIIKFKDTDILNDLSTTECIDIILSIDNDIVNTNMQFMILSIIDIQTILYKQTITNVIDKYFVESCILNEHIYKLYIYPEILCKMRNIIKYELLRRYECNPANNNNIFNLLIGNTFETLFI
jgi:hypothetical protein